MKKLNYEIILLVLLTTFSIKAYSQEIRVLRGTILNQSKEAPLAYANVVVLHRNTGTISNESGGFIVDISQLADTDTLSFQYIGFQTKKISIGSLDSNATIYLKEEIINLNEAFVFSDPPKAEFIVKQVLINREKNYKTESAVKQSFIRRKNISDIENIKIRLKRNDIPVLNKELIKVLENKLPKHNTSYTDFLGDIYFLSSLKDSIKVKPTRTVSLKEEEITDLKQFEKIFTDLFKGTKENEYWKIKSGILSQKIVINMGDSAKKDSSKVKDFYKIPTRNYNNNFKKSLVFTQMQDDNKWEFLHKTQRYNFELIGGTSVSGESVYIIDFKAKNSGKYKGRLYISLESYALIRADYEFDDGKTGTNIHLLGVGYTESNFSASVFFEKRNNNYVLKYFSKKEDLNFSLDRNISLIKKRERFLFDKELYEIKVKFNITVNNQESLEFLHLNNKTISPEQFKSTKQADKMKIILVNEFNDKLWEGYPIIEPTKNMREYRKTE